MSKEEKVTAENNEKVITKYDRKVERRAQEKIQARRDARNGRIISILILVLLAGFILYFPVSKICAQKRAVCTVDGDPISQIEFDFFYNAAINSYVNSYRSYLQYMGLDTSKDLSQQMYDENMTWKDYFEEQAVNTIVNQKGMLKKIKEEGFKYDADKDFKDYVESLKSQAKENDTTVSKLIKDDFGQYATLKSIERLKKESILVSEYMIDKKKTFEPTEEEAEAVYAEDTSEYDCVDYKFILVNAELPTEPTELAEEGAAVDEDGNYTPSDAEKEAAMKVAKEEADSKLEALDSEGEERTGIRKSSVSSVIVDWLFDDSRKADDTTVIEDTSSNRYYVLKFIGRYRNDKETANLRVIFTDTDPATVYDEFMATAKTEDDFKALFEKYDVSGLDDEGLLENASDQDLVYEDLVSWVSDANRKVGDVEKFSNSDADESGNVSSGYLVYYLGKGLPTWRTEINSSVSTEKLNEYMEEVADTIKVEDPKGNLNYLKVRAEQEAQASEEATVSDSDATADSEAAVESKEEVEADDADAEADAEEADVNTEAEDANVEAEAEE
ncbi:MAG: SurA N-terminal domain-containing protein [Lachnospiraceae bacterium]|nr:SurA N-terminal domain-containing protein [Lachnospiraceae bacterium]